ncbi:unnamed protein product [Rotaria sp. Silwood2]|nr:unnamed protein product [Rotaria sp. Silwood2]
MHAGQLSLDPKHHETLFFWHFASKYTSDKPRTVIWFNGGPGCSSLIGAWTEIGPFRFQDENTIIENDGSWNMFANLLFVDQPVGTGFSYIDTDSRIHELNEMANHFLSFLGRYIEVFPELLQNDIYLAGESFAGQYIPYIAKEILTKRSNLKLRGLLMGNAYIDPMTMYESYLPFAVENNLVKIILYSIMISAVKSEYASMHFPKKCMFSRKNVNLYYEYLKSLIFNQSLLINETYNDYKIWIDESVDYVCKQVYFDDNNIKLNVSRNFTLGDEYFNRNWPLIDQRLTQAGRRLASLLNQLAKNRSSRKFPPDTQALIIVLCIALAIGIFAVLSVCLYKRKHIIKHNVLISE